MCVIVGADVGCDRKSRWHRNSDASHFVQTRSLAAKEVAHSCFAFGFTVAEGIDDLFLFAHRSSLRLWLCFLHGCLCLWSRQRGSILLYIIEKSFRKEDDLISRSMWN